MAMFLDLGEASFGLRALRKMPDQMTEMSEAGLRQRFVDVSFGMAPQNGREPNILQLVRGAGPLVQGNSRMEVRHE